MNDLNGSENKDTRALTSAGNVGASQKTKTITLVFRAYKDVLIYPSWSTAKVADLGKLAEVLENEFIKINLPIEDGKKFGEALRLLLAKPWREWEERTLVYDLEKGEIVKLTDWTRVEA
jgi:hypothetical protein